MINSLEGMSIHYGFVLGEYKGKKVHKIGKEVIIWTSNAYLLTSGAEPGSGVLPVDVIVDAYLLKYPYFG